MSSPCSSTGGTGPSTATTYEDWDFDNEWDIVALAYRNLEFQAEEGHIGTFGVECGGVLVDRHELRARYNYYGEERG